MLSPVAIDAVPAEVPVPDAVDELAQLQAAVADRAAEAAQAATPAAHGAPTPPAPPDDGVRAALGVLAEPSVAAAALREMGILEQLAAATPRHVAMPGNIVDLHEDTTTPSKVTGRRVVATDCPDCTRGTSSAAGVLVCIQLPRVEPALLAGAQPGDIIACGRTR